MTMMDLFTPYNSLTDVWSILSTQRAVAIYLIVLLVAVVFLVISVLVSAHSSPRVVSIVKGDRKIGSDDAREEPSDGNGADEEAAEELPTESAEQRGSGGVRFGSLVEIDRRMSGYIPAPYHNRVSLEELCDKFRLFAAYKRHLYYDIDDIRRFVASLGVSHIIVMQGMSGTGKTSLATVFGAFVDHDSTVIPIQPMWKERSDMIGYFNEFTERFNETVLLQTLYEATYSRDLFITVLDEMNIARVEYYFADFLSLLELPEKKDRKLEVVSDTWDNDPLHLEKGKLILPENMWYVGTANNDDSTFAISDKVYDRAMIINLDKKAEPFTAPPTESLHISCDDLQELYEQAKGEFTLTRRTVRKLQLLDEYMIEHFHVTFGNRIMKQIKQYIPIYIACGGTELEALDDIFSKKILRKLESQNPVYIRNAADGLLNQLDDLFGADAMPLCKETLARLRGNV